MATIIPDTEGYTDGAYELPSAKESGSDVFQILEDFMTRMGKHKHEGVDSQVITTSLDKTKKEYVPSWGDVDASVDTSGNKYMDLDLGASSGIYSRASAGSTTVNDIVYRFYYLKEDNETVLAGSQPGHIQFYPDVSWTDYKTLRITTNISETISAGHSSAPKIILKAY